MFSLKEETMKYKSLPMLLIITFFLFLIAPTIIAFSNNSDNHSLTENDLKVIENGDSNSASYVLYKMEQLYNKEGKAPIIPAIPVLIKRANNDLKTGDLEDELFGEIIWALSVTGDKRVEQVLFDTMLCPNISDWDVAKGFLNIGITTLPPIMEKLYDICDSSKNIDKITKINVIVTLAKMGEFDSKGTYFTENDKKVIKQEMLKMIRNSDENLRRVAVMAVGNFGDRSSVPILEEITKTDPYVAENGKYFVRMEAEEAIKKIMKQR
jgi:hypothetical protein